MKLQNWLATLAGARNDVLEQTPTDPAKYVATGGVILTTAAVAAVSAIFAMTMAVHLAVVPSVLVGLGWGFVVLNLDRLLVVGMVRQSGWRRNAVVALPRLALAVLIGAIISMPLVLRIFQPEIVAEMNVLQNERQAAFQTQLKSDPRFTQIPVLEQRATDLQQVADRNADVSALADPAVQAAQREVERTRGVYDQAQQFAVCEIQGTCGTNVPGIALAARQRIEARDVALRDYNDARTALQRATDAARAASNATAAAARQDLTRVQGELDARRAELATARSEYASEVKDDGLLSRIEALYSLSAKRPALGLAHWAVFLLFLSIEVMPILVKLLQLAGPKTLYEQIIDNMEADAKSAAAIRIARKREIENSLADREVAQAIRKSDAQRKANEGNRPRRPATERAVPPWADQAETWSEDETARRYREHASHPNPTQPPLSAVHHNGSPLKDPADTNSTIRLSVQPPRRPQTGPTEGTDTEFSTAEELINPVPRTSPPGIDSPNN